MSVLPSVWTAPNQSEIALNARRGGVVAPEQARATHVETFRVNLARINPQSFNAGERLQVALALFDAGLIDAEQFRHMLNTIAEPRPRRLRGFLRR